MDEGRQAYYNMDERLDAYYSTFSASRPTTSMPSEMDAGSTLSDRHTSSQVYTGHHVPSDMSTNVQTASATQITGLSAWDALWSVAGGLDMTQLIAVDQIIASAVEARVDTRSLSDAVQSVVLIVRSNTAIPALNVVTNWTFVCEAVPVIMDTRPLEAVQYLLASLDPTVSIEELHQMLRVRIELLRHGHQSLDQFPVPVFGSGPTTMEGHLAGITSPSDSTSSSSEEPIIILPCKCASGRGCSGFIKITPHTDLKNVVAAHLAQYHDIPPSTLRECSWENCFCSPQANHKGCPQSHMCTDCDECTARKCRHPIPPHSAHVKDMADHVIKVHLNLRFGCDECGRPTFKSDSAAERHRKDCRSGPVLCGYCYVGFRSEIAVGGHFLTCASKREHHLRVRNDIDSTRSSSSQVG